MKHFLALPLQFSFRPFGTQASGGLSALRAKLKNQNRERAEGKNGKKNISRKGKGDGVEDSFPEYSTVPSSSFSRVFEFGQLAAGVAAGTFSEIASRSTGGRGITGKESGETQGASPIASEANVELIVSTLCRMRGAALKLGQMVSISSALPPQYTEILERVRTSAHRMPVNQVETVMSDALGVDWREKFASFSDEAFASASIGQVHKASVFGELDCEGEAFNHADCNGKEVNPVVVKVQYPGVAESIDSDLLNLQRLARVTGGLVIPKGLYLENLVAVAKVELIAECDYLREAQSQIYYAEQLKQAMEVTDINSGIKGGDIWVPRVYPNLSSDRVLTTEFASGVPIDKVVHMSQEIRDSVAARLLQLTIWELFYFQFMQTDPNWSNYLYDVEMDRVTAIDFGAARTYRSEFTNDYFDVVWGSSEKDEELVLRASKRLGFLTGDENEVMNRAHLDASSCMGEPFQTEIFDFTGSDIPERVAEEGKIFLENRLTPPPPEVYSLHRKLMGCYTTCIKLGARVPARAMILRAAQYMSKRKGVSND